jgi:hypothetical protein
MQAPMDDDLRDNNSDADPVPVLVSVYVRKGGTQRKSETLMLSQVRLLRIQIVSREINFTR